MVQKNLLEVALGLRFESAKHWDPHPLVGLSALFFVVPAVAFWAVVQCILEVKEPPYTPYTLLQVVLYPLLGLLFSCVSVTCLLADYVFIKRGHRSCYGRIDICLASLALVVCVLDFKLRASALETILLTLIAVAAFLFSGLSTSYRQWVFRHCLWHAVAGADATYGALRLPPEPDTLKRELGGYLVCVGFVYACLIGATLAALALLPATWRGRLWDTGANIASWQPVAGIGEEAGQLEQLEKHLDYNGASEMSSSEECTTATGGGDTGAESA